MDLNQAELNKILESHQRWLETGGFKGKKANLYRANLSEANLEGANLEGANLICANLREANLEGVVLVGANLYIANLRKANLEGANLRRANLREANLDGANLEGANLEKAYLLGVFLNNTKLPFPIYQFCLGKHSAVATPNYLQIGCIQKSWGWWFNNWEKAGLDNGYSQQEIERYGTMIDQVYGLIQDELDFS